LQVQSLPLARIGSGVAAVPWLPATLRYRAVAEWRFFCRRGNPFTGAALAAVVGFFTVGLFAGPFDTPRPSARFLAVLAVGLHAAPAAVTASKRHPKPPWGRKRESKR
jgi:hypothetical protein